MVSKLIRQVRCDDVLTAFLKGNNQAVFFTLTTKDCIDIYTIRFRWRRLRHYLVEKFGKGFKFVMNYELHPNGHGWHIHGVANRFINLRGGGLKKIQGYGFGRVDVRQVSSKGVADYLTKHALKAYRGVKGSLKIANRRLRLVNTSRGLPTLNDYFWRSKFKDKINQSSKDFLRLNHHRKIISYGAAELKELFDLSTDQATDLMIKRIDYFRREKLLDRLKLRQARIKFKKDNLGLPLFNRK